MTGAWTVRDSNGRLLAEFTGVSALEVGRRIVPTRYDAFRLHVSSSYRAMFDRAVTLVLERQGWQSEGASGGMVFVRRGNERRLLAVHEHDPHEPLPPGHGAPAGRCATCE